jgi:RNA polymerase sigma-B factor
VKKTIDGTTAEMAMTRTTYTEVDDSRSVDATAGLPAEEDIVLCHIGLARSLARRYANRGERLEDLEQVAMVGLVKAARRFEAARGTAFSTYATATITGELKRHFRDKRWALHVSRSAQERYLVVRDTVEELQASLQRSPTVVEIAEAASLDVQQVTEAQELNATFHLDRLDAITQTSAAAASSHAEDAFVAADWRLSVRAAVEKLDPRSQTLVHLRFVAGLSQREIATELGISQMQVSRLLAAALEKLRRYLC